MTNKYMYVFGPSSFVTALATKKVQTCRKVDKSLTMGQESTYLIVLLEIATMMSIAESLFIFK